MNPGLNFKSIDINVFLLLRVIKFPIVETHMNVFIPTDEYVPC